MSTLLKCTLSVLALAIVCLTPLALVSRSSSSVEMPLAADSGGGRFGATPSPQGPAGGQLVGTYPNPGIAPGDAASQVLQTVNVDGGRASRWLPSATISASIVYRPNGVALGNVCTTDTCVRDFIAANNGAALVYVDNSLVDGGANPALIHSGVTWTFHGYGAILSASTTFASTLEVQAGGQIVDVNELTNLIVNTDTTSAGTPAFQFSQWALGPLLQFNGSTLNLTATDTQAPIQVPAGDVLSLFAYNDAFFSSAASGTVPLIALGAGSGGAGSGGSLAAYLLDVPAVTLPVQLFSGDSTTVYYWLSNAAGFPIPTWTLFTGTVGLVDLFDTAAGVSYSDTVTPLLDAGTVQIAIDQLKRKLGVVPIDAGTSGYLPPARITACTNGLSIVAVGGVETCQLVALDAGTSGSLPTSRLSGLIAIDAGTSGPLPPSRIVVGSNGQIMQSNTISPLWNTMSGDCTINGSGVVTCTQAQAGELTFGASTGTITGASGATAVGLAQASTSGATAAAMVDTTQTSTNASGTTGNRIFNFAAPTSATAVTPYGRIVAQYAGVNEVEIGYDPYWGSAIFFGTPNTSNAAMYGTSTTTNVNASAVASLILGGATYAVKAVASTSDVTIGSHYNLGMTAVNTGDYGGGQGVFGMSAAATAPSAAPSTAGDSVVWSDANGFNIWTHAGNHTIIP